MGKYNVENLFDFSIQFYCVSLCVFKLQQKHTHTRMNYMFALIDNRYTDEPRQQ